MIICPKSWKLRPSPSHKAGGTPRWTVSVSLSQCVWSPWTSFNDKRKSWHMIYSVHCTSSPQLWYFVKQFWHVPPDVGLLLLLLCSQPNWYSNWNFPKKTKQKMATESERMTQTVQYGRKNLFLRSGAYYRLSKVLFFFSGGRLPDCL